MTDYLNALVVFANFVFVPALTYGCQLALGSLGVTMIYSVLRFSNFAQGETMAFGTVITIMVTWLLQSWGVSLGFLPTALLALPIGILVTALVLLLTDRYVYRYYRTKRSKSITFVMASLGVMFIMNGVVRLLLGPNDQNFADGERFFLTADAFRAWTGLDEALVIRTSQALTIILAVILVVALFWFLQRTKTGKAMRAYADNENLALLSGINPDRIVRITWIITAALATVAGVLYGLDKGYKPLSYYNLLLPIFAAVIVGGIGKPIGAIVGGFIIAFSEVIVTYAYKKVLTYVLPTDMAPDGLVQLLSTEYKFAVSFVILVIVLLVKPTGLFKGKVL
ncbi:branched-chain amino acid ABC transporter permease [uncultured Thiothrix sp.]|uniref:branched-chain amino acid ABC transporter permease n=1 Tax=uncultured Thiothrix sp. TaxID=223185 RepID=UPI00261D80D4|nr:branched-chain amino acid ABC transporter permease [uncultured Thiothrix sp.]